jgi:hypothetical protein
MIVWLAAYPRSGNTLVRLLLKRLFGVSTFSLYDDPADIGADPTVAHELGHRSHGLTNEGFYEMASTKPEMYFVKTHDLPRDDAPAIYIIRDGRASTRPHTRHGCRVTNLRWFLSRKRTVFAKP